MKVIGCKNSVKFCNVGKIIKFFSVLLSLNILSEILFKTFYLKIKHMLENFFEAYVLQSYINFILESKIIWETCFWNWKKKWKDFVL